MVPLFGNVCNSANFCPCVYVQYALYLYMSLIPLFCFRALETNKYNHITATYYLLAERILREKQEKDVQTRSSSPSNIKAQFR